MYIIQEAKQQILKELKKAVGKGFAPTIQDLALPPDVKMGDIAFHCFILAKGMERNPVEIANEIAAKIGPKNFIKSVQANGPYVNFIFEDAKFGEELISEILEEGDDYGYSESGKGKKALVEYANPNTHKNIHVGHLRNFAIGQAAVNVLKTNGYDVLPTSYINDLGTHVAACLWAMKKDGYDMSGGSKEISYFGKMYQKAQEAMEKDAKVKSEISKIHQELEKGKGEYYQLWKKTRKWSLDYLKSVFKEFGLTIEYWYFESDLIDETRKIIEKLIGKGIATHSEGAWIVDLEKEGFGVNLLVKSDGTLLYNAKDLALAERKEEDHHAQRSIYVVDARQSLAMNQLFATLKRMGFEKELKHLSYEFVTLKDGAMSSRKGNVIPYDEFRDSMINMAEKETKARHKDWSDKKIKKTSKTISFAAMKFGMLKQDIDKVITFDLKESMSFDGFTGPYLLYTNSRISSILKKAGRAKPKVVGKNFKEKQEHKLLMKLAQYPEVVFETGRDLHISRIAQYSFDLCKTFAEYYESVPVLKAKEEKSTRLATVKAAGQVLENALYLLGIESVKEM